MTQYWLSIALGGIFLFLLVPIKITVGSNPNFKSEISWIFFKIRFVLVDKSLSISFHLFNCQVWIRKKLSESRKTTTGKKKKSSLGKGKPRKKSTLSLIKTLVNHSSVPKILKKSLYLFRRLFNSLSIKRLHWDISVDDYFIQGILQGLISGFPQTKKIAIRGNFEEINSFSLKVHLSSLKMLGALLFFTLTFPYLDSLRLYKKIKTIA